MGVQCSLVLIPLLALLFSSGCTLRGEQHVFEELDVPPVIGLPESVATIFEVSCGSGPGCHTGSPGSFGLSLDPEVALDNLVNVKATLDAGAFRVVPGDPDNSFLIAKVRGTGAGSLMPVGIPALSEAQIGDLEAWIAAMDPIPVVEDDVVDSDTEDVVEDVKPISDDGAPEDSDTPGIDPVPENVGVILEEHCASCHKGKAAAAGLVLTADVAAENLIGISATKESYDGILLVSPGDPDASLIVKKIEGISEFGSLMPLGGPALETENIQVIRDWISGLDTGTPPEDVVTPTEDVVEPPEDTGTPPEDTGTPPEDTGTPPEDTGTPPEDTGTPTEPACKPKNATFEVSYQQVIDLLKKHCADCHAYPGSGELQMFDGEQDLVVETLVGVASANEPTKTRVVAGSSMTSYFIEKLEGNQLVGLQMPQYSPALPSADIDIIKSWIDDCAKKSAVVGEPTQS